MNASDSEDDVVDEVSSVGFSFFFLLPWVSGLMARSHVFYVMSTCTRRQPHIPHGLDLQREWESSGKVGNKTSGVADEIAAVRATERRFTQRF